MLTRLDLNCDMGESADPAREALEARLMPRLTSVNIACGLHAGDERLMRRLIRLAGRHGVRIGAHPGYRDPAGFGRQEQRLPADEIESLVAYQVGALRAIAALEDAQVCHVKPHGGLYNLAARDRGIADAIARAVARIDPALILVGLAGSMLVEAGRAIGLRVAEEAFVDRGYRATGALIPRTMEGALITDEAAVRERLRRLVVAHRLPSIDGPEVVLRPDTLCLHADTPGAARLAEVVHEALTAADVTIGPLR